MEDSEGLMKGGDYFEEWKKTMKRTIKPGVIIKIVSCFLNTKMSSTLKYMIASVIDDE